MRILTFNHHEPYLCMLAKTGLSIDVIVKYKKTDLSWSSRAHPAPNNLHLIEFDNSIKEKLKSGYYHLVICHTIKNLIWMFPFFRPKFIFIAHIFLFKHSVSLAIKSFLKIFLLHLFFFTHKSKFIAISPRKYESWGVSGIIIKNFPLDAGLKAPRNGDENDKLLIIGNNIKERGDEAGYSIISQLMQKYPIMIVGNNPNIENAYTPKSYQDFLEVIRKARIYLFLISPNWDEGYNLGMLEAMRMGMPVITFEHPNSPIIHGQNGLIVKDYSELVQQIDYLLSNKKEVDRLGANAKQTIEFNFSEEKFVSEWNSLIDNF